MDFILEALVQFLFEIVGQILFEAGFHASAAILRSRFGRFVVAAAVGLAGGLWWGERLSSAGRVQEPRALWVSIGLSVVAAALGLRQQVTHAVTDEGPGLRSVLAPPWKWPTYRLVGFAALNAAIAVGIAVSFRPHPIVH